MGLFDRLFGPPSKDKFAKLMMDGIRRAGERGVLRYDPREFCIIGEGEITNKSFLANAYREFCSAPRSLRASVLQRWVRTWFVTQKEPPQDFEDVHPDLLPVVRSRSYFEFARLVMED